MIRVLVTGAGGQLAQALVAQALDYPGLLLEMKSREELDITQKEAVEKELANGYNYCVNTAAYTAVDKAEEEPDRAYEVNAQGVQHLAEACKKYETTLIHISTDYVFDGTKTDGKYVPHDPPNPINQYGLSKYKGELFLKESWERSFIIRTSWLYDHENVNFYTKVLALARQGNTLRVTTSEEGIPTHTSVVARFILDLIDNGDTRYGVHHVSGSTPMSRYEFAKQILSENGLLKQGNLIPSATYEARARRPKRVFLMPN